jgi:hypothetical protein
MPGRTEPVSQEIAIKHGESFDGVAAETKKAATQKARTNTTIAFDKNRPKK